MTVFRAATLQTFFFAFHVGAKELNLSDRIFINFYGNTDICMITNKEKNSFYNINQT